MRLMNKSELKFLVKLLKNNTSFKVNLYQLSQLQVEEADDGGMGGLIFLSKNQGRRLGKDIANYEFKDQDGVTVITTLSLDNFGDLYELDVWKTNFSKLINFPT